MQSTAENLKPTLTYDGILVERPLYTITIVCPVCHTPLSQLSDGVITCDQCEARFILKTRGVGPSETK